MPQNGVVSGIFFSVKISIRGDAFFVHREKCRGAVKGVYLKQIVKAEAVEHDAQRGKLHVIHGERLTGNGNEKIVLLAVSHVPVYDLGNILILLELGERICLNIGVAHLSIRRQNHSVFLYEQNFFGAVVGHGGKEFFLLVKREAAGIAGEKYSFDTPQALVDRVYLKVIDLRHLLHHAGHRSRAGAVDVFTRTGDEQRAGNYHYGEHHQHGQQKGPYAVVLFFTLHI